VSGGSVLLQKTKNAVCAKQIFMNKQALANRYGL